MWTLHIGKMLNSRKQRTVQQNIEVKKPKSISSTSQVANCFALNPISIVCVGDETACVAIWHFATIELEFQNRIFILVNLFFVSYVVEIRLK